MTSGIFWVTEPPETFYPKWFKNFSDQVYAQLAAVVLRYQPQIESWLKANAPWTDQTGNLRQSLYAEVELLVDLIVLSWDYGLDYGQFLEFGNFGRFAVIAPAFDFFVPKIMGEVKAILQ